MPSWPEKNYGTRLHNLDADPTGKGYTPIISIPRPKHTWFVYMEIDPQADVSNFLEGVREGRILAAMKSVDHPQVTYKTEKLNSYNKIRVVPTGIEYKSVNLTFYDDTTSYVPGLLKAYRQFYHYSGDATSEGDFGDGVGQTPRPRLPSIGMKSRTGGRNFFRKIVIIDLGTSPNSINIYNLVNPVISDTSHANLDYYDLPGMVDISLTLDYEGYYEKLGGTIDDYAFIFDQLEGDMQVAEVSPQTGGFFDRAFGLDLGTGIFGETVNQIAENIIQGAPAILSAAFANGEFNSKNFKRQLFSHAAQGTPIQDVRNAMTTIELIEGRVDQKDIVGVLAGARRLDGILGDLGTKVFSPTETPVRTTDKSTSASISASDLIRKVGSGGFDWGDF